MKGFDCKTFETQKGSRTKFFGTVSQKTWRRSWCPPPLFTSTFFIIKNFLKHRKVPLRNVSLLGNKHFRSTVVIPRPFLSSTFSPSGKLSETQQIPWRTLLVLWNKIVLRRIVIPLPFLCMKNFDARFFWIEEVFPNEMFQNCETKKLTENRFLSKKKHFSISKSFWSTIGFLYEMFRFWETNIFEAQSWSPTLSFCKISSIWKFIWNTEGFLNELFWYCETK